MKKSNMLWPCEVSAEKQWGWDKKWHHLRGNIDGVGLRVRKALDEFMAKHPQRVHFLGASIKVTNPLGTVTEFLINPDDGKVEFI